MDKREEIREELNSIIGNCLIAVGGGGSCPHIEIKALVAQEDCLNEILNYLHSQGVVIRVDKKLPEPSITTDSFPQICNLTCHLIEQKEMLRAGYVAVEPLIKDDSKDG